MSIARFVDLPHAGVYAETTKLLEDLPFLRRMHRMFEGLAKPRDSGDYKAAVLQLERLSAPFLAVMVPILVLMLMIALAGSVTKTERVVFTDFVEPAGPTPPLQKPPEPPTWTSTEPQVPTYIPSGPGSSGAPEPPSAPPVRPDGAGKPTLPVRGPIIPVGTPGGGVRGPGAVAVWVDTGDSPPGSESMVERALRWLKTRQQPDGSWPKNKDAMTALAVLTFLAHGERPGESAEFGDTVQAGIEYLMKTQRADGTWPGNYEHPIATYALCEAYGMTRNPFVREAAQRGVMGILRGQHPSGGWDYGMKQSGRDDTSVMGWTAQALKAAKVSDVLDDKELLDGACALAVQGFLRNACPEGGFGYTGPGAGGLSSVGTLCLQLLGAGKHTQVERTLRLMDGWKLSWDAPKVPGQSPQYYFYYATQAMFLGGGARWKAWNAAMVSEYAKAQKVTPKEQAAYVDANGTPRAVGWWENADQHGDRPVMDTCLVTLQLMVYYRYLPTYRSPEFASGQLTAGTDDVPVSITL